ncbi:MAG: lipoyl(octanoyl) transferase LipB [Deltaproteobacteria bacterium]|nr:lipoyl(octanoyl) transferase LipB [Deltaproteobacteria bacterium]
MKTFYAYDLGLTNYREALALQQRLAERRQRGDISDVLLLTEHTPVVTIGRFVKSDELEKEICVPRERILEQGISVVPCDRGGRLTYHGPGQLVAYPIIHLQEKGLGVKQYVWMLEESIIKTVGHFGINGQRRSGLNGVWIGEKKIAAIGLHVSEGVSRHGIALNVDVDLYPYGLIIPCGITNLGVTSITDTLDGKNVPMPVVKTVFANSMSRILNIDIRPMGGMSECLFLLENYRSGSRQIS